METERGKDRGSEILFLSDDAIVHSRLILREENEFQVGSSVQEGKSKFEAAKVVILQDCSGMSQAVQKNLSINL